MHTSQPKSTRKEKKKKIRSRNREGRKKNAKTSARMCQLLLRWIDDIVLANCTTRMEKIDVILSLKMRYVFLLLCLKLIQSCGTMYRLCTIFYTYRGPHCKYVCTRIIAYEKVLCIVMIYICFHLFLVITSNSLKILKKQLSFAS